MCPCGVYRYVVCDNVKYMYVVCVYVYMYDNVNVCMYVRMHVCTLVCVHACGSVHVIMWNVVCLYAHSTRNCIPLPVSRLYIEWASINN